MAFINATNPVLRSLSSRHSTASAKWTCEQRSEHSHSVSRRELLANIAAAAAAAAAVVTAAGPLPAAAKNGEGLERAFSKVLFPKEGFNAPDAVAPSSDIIDRDVLAKPEAKAALAKLRTYSEDIDRLYSDFKKDPQIELSASVKKISSISELREALNIVNEAIDEDTQLKTDKVVRGIIQDIGELEIAAALKPGSSRTKRKIERTGDWFDKLTGDFKRLLSFYA